MLGRTSNQPGWLERCNVLVVVLLWDTHSYRVLQYKGAWRVCQLCGTGFGDEMHLVFECTAMTDLRGQFPDIFKAQQTMQQFMWQPNLLQVAKFLDAGMKDCRRLTLMRGRTSNQPGWE